MKSVSVIVPFFNDAAFVGQCLDSLLCQTYPRIQIVIVDDGSRPEQALALRPYERLSKHVKVRCHEGNRGPGAARNTGLDEADGDFLLFVDSDDYVDQNYVEVLVTAAERSGGDVVESGVRRVSKDGILVEEYLPSPSTTDMGNSGADEVLKVREWGVTQKLWARETIAASGVRFNEGMFWEDIAVVPCWMMSARTIHRVAYCGYNYRTNAASITNTIGVKKIVDAVGAFDFAYRSMSVTPESVRRDFVHKAFTNFVRYYSGKVRQDASIGKAKKERILSMLNALNRHYAPGNLAFTPAHLAALDDAIEGSRMVHHRRSQRDSSALEPQLQTYLLGAIHDCDHVLAER